MDMNTTGKRIVALRTELGITQENLSNLIGVSLALIAMWETDQREIAKLSHVSKLADVLHCSTDYLLCRTNVRSSDMDIQSMCNYTGLSDTSVTVLHYLETVSDVNGINGQTAALVNYILAGVYKDFQQIIESERAISIPVITLFTKMNQYIKGTGNNNPVKLSTDIPTVLSENDVCRMIYLDSILDSLKGLAREADGKKKPYSKSDFLDAARTIARACESNPEAFLDINVKDIVNDAFASARQFAPVLRSLREKKAVSIKEAAAGIGCSFKTLREYESGERIPRDEIKIKIAEYYEVPACDIFYQNENEELQSRKDSVIFAPHDERNDKVDDTLGKKPQSEPNRDKEIKKNMKKAIASMRNDQSEKKSDAGQIIDVLGSTEDEFQYNIKSILERNKNEISGNREKFIAFFEETINDIKLISKEFDLT